MSTSVRTRQPSPAFAGWDETPSEPGLQPLTREFSMPRAAAITRVRHRIASAAIAFAALCVASAYVLVPLTVALHVLVHPLLAVLFVAAAALAESVLVMTVIVIKTENRAV